MESSFHGQLAEKPTSNLIREIAEGHLSGLLRFCQEETVKAIFFEGGAPVFAASNLPAEQLEHKLLMSGSVDADLIVEARRRSLTPQELGWTLVEVGAISQLSMDWSIHELATEIILSVFEWEHGVYTFYEDSGLDLGTKLDWPPAECVLAGARRAARIDSVANAVAPPHRLVSQTLGSPSSFGGLSTLNSVEGFVLSSVVAPTPIREISSLTGLPESEARSAVFALLALGLLRLEDEEKQSASDKPVEPAKPLPAVPQDSFFPGFDSGRYGGASLEWVLDVVARKLTFIESANYYEQLGTERIAPTSRITDAYQEMRERFDSFKSRWPENQELAQQVEALLAKLEQAYGTLSDPEKRSAYDRPPSAKVKASKRIKAVKPVGAMPAARPTSDRKALVPLSGTGFDVASPPRSDVARVRAGQVFDPLAMAEQQYNRGRAHFDQRDFHSAVHLFREAAKLDASQSRYHYYLGVTLSVLSQARQAHKEHTHDKGCHVTCTLGGSLIRNQRIRREAEQHMLRAAELDRLNAEVRLRLALLYRDAGMEKKAQHYFLETLMLDANNTVAQRELGMDQKPLP